jgi:hypothetical protein
MAIEQAINHKPIFELLTRGWLPPGFLAAGFIGALAAVVFLVGLVFADESFSGVVVIVYLFVLSSLDGRQQALATSLLDLRGHHCASR